MESLSAVSRVGQKLATELLGLPGVFMVLAIVSIHMTRRSIRAGGE